MDAWYCVTGWYRIGCFSWGVRILVTFRLGGYNMPGCGWFDVGGFVVSSAVSTCSAKSGWLSMEGRT
jgi:hypothetical protein